MDFEEFKQKVILLRDLAESQYLLNEKMQCESACAFWRGYSTGVGVLWTFFNDKENPVRNWDGGSYCAETEYHTILGEPCYSDPSEACSDECPSYIFRDPDYEYDMQRDEAMLRSFEERLP